MKDKRKTIFRGGLPGKRGRGLFQARRSTFRTSRFRKRERLRGACWKRCRLPRDLRRFEKANCQTLFYSPLLNWNGLNNIINPAALSQRACVNSSVDFNHGDQNQKDQGAALGKAHQQAQGFVQTVQNRAGKNCLYQSLDYFYKHKFNSKVFKVSLNAGFTCPNKDGKVGLGGCIYCSKSGSGEYAGDIKKDLVTQFNEVKDIMLKKWPKAKYIGYFQANTNTYAPLSVLKEKYETILKLDNVVGLSIATRPDAINNECLNYLEELSKKTYLTIELGLQTIHESTSKFINRCHDLNCFKDMVKELRKRNINVVVHIINGLPYETKDMMIDTVKYLSKLDIQGIKIHMLSILKDTKLEKIYKEDKFKLISRDEYIDIVCNQLEYLREDIVVNRITGDPKVSDLIEPDWLIKKVTIINDIDKEMKKRNSYQGIKYKKQKDSN